MMPQFLGAPFYPEGRPLTSHEIESKGKTMFQLFLEYEEEVKQNPNEQLLKEFVFYYINAPAFIVPVWLTMKMKVIKDVTLAEILLDCLDIGIDPF